MKKLLLVTTIIFSLMLIVSPVFAQTTDSDPDHEYVNTTTEVIQSIDRIAAFMYTGLLSIAVIVLIYAAFIYLTAGGDPTKTSRGHKILLYAVAAIAIAILSKGVTVVITGVLKT